MAFSKNTFKTVIERSYPLDASRAKDYTLRIAEEKYWTLCYEWNHPGKQEAQNPNAAMVWSHRSFRDKSQATVVEKGGVMLGADCMDVRKG